MLPERECHRRGIESGVAVLQKRAQGKLQQSGYSRARAETYQKRAYITDRRATGQRLTEQVIEHATRLPEGTPVAAKSLLRLGNRAAVDRALSRIDERGQLVRAGRGVYLLPVTSRFGTRLPSVEHVVEALALRGEVIVSSSAAAANSLGLTLETDNIPFSGDGPVIFKNGPFAFTPYPALHIPFTRRDRCRLRRNETRRRVQHRKSTEKRVHNPQKTPGRKVAIRPRSFLYDSHP